MERPESGVPVIELPERVDRRMRLGPFPSARDALKFVGYAATGAVLSPLAGPYFWLPVVGVGFAVSVWHMDGEAVDERAGRWLLFRLRLRTEGTLTARTAFPTPAGPVARLSSGRRVSVVRTAGVPFAYRPPADLTTLFDRFRELLRASDGTMVIRATTAPLRVDPLLPRLTSGSPTEVVAREGYAELVLVLCRRRRSRRVDLALGTREAGPEGARRLAERTRSLAERLAALGLHPVVLEGRPLGEAVRGFGWTLAREDR